MKNMKNALYTVPTLCVIIKTLLVQTISVDVSLNTWYNNHSNIKVVINMKFQSFSYALDYLVTRHIG